MKIGYPKEIKPGEHRFLLSPDFLKQLLDAGHEVLMERGAGASIGRYDEEYEHVQRAHPQGTQFHLTDRESIFAQSDMVVMVKEPQRADLPAIKARGESLVVFDYLHLAADKDLTTQLMDTGAMFIGFETMKADNGSLPLLRPMSEVAGKLSAEAIDRHLKKHYGGPGILIGGAEGVGRAHIVIIGGGVSGEAALHDTLGKGANVTLIDISKAKLDAMKEKYSPLAKVTGGEFRTVESTPEAIRTEVLRADAVVGAALVPGREAPELLTTELLEAWAKAKPNSVFVDIAIDQGGIYKQKGADGNTQTTSHKEPCYRVGGEDGIQVYAVPNMPAAAAKTASIALAKEVDGFVLKMATDGVTTSLLEASEQGRMLLGGLNVYQGKLTCQEVGDAFGMEVTAPAALLKGNSNVLQHPKAGTQG